MKVSDPSKIPGLVAIILAALLIVGFVVPSMALTGDNADSLASLLPEDSGITSDDLKNVSLLKFLIWTYQEEDVDAVIDMIVMGAVSVLILLFALARLATPIALLSALYYWMFGEVIKYHFGLVGPNGTYNWTFVHWLCQYIPPILVVVAIVLFVTKIIRNRNRKRAGA